MMLLIAYKGMILILVKNIVEFVDNIVEFVDNIDDSDDGPTQSLQKDNINIG